MTDVKIVHSGQTEKYRLAQQDSRKLWSVISPATELEVEYNLNDASLGVGLLREQQGAPGTQLRIADGYGVDLSEAGLVKHGPGGTSIGSYSGTAKTVGTYSGRTFLLTSTNLYSWDGVTQTTEMTGVTLNNSWAVHGTSLYIAGGSNGLYKEAGWGTSSTVSVTTPTDVQLIASLPDGASNKMFIASDATIYSSSTPDSDNFSSIIVLPENINNLWVMGGYLFAQTASHIFLIHNDKDGVPVSVELNSKTKLMSNTSAGTILDTEGQETWSSDGNSLWLLRVLGFNEFDVTPAGPFETTQAVPVTSDIRGTILDVSIDIDAIYVTVLRGSDSYTYKGVEKARGIFVWSPLIKWGSSTVDVARVSAYNGDSHLYVAFSGSWAAFKLHDWTVYNTDWQIDTMFLNNGEPTVDKIHHRLLTRVDRTGGNIQPASRVTESGSFVNIGGAVSTDTGVNMGNKTGKEIQLRITMSGNSTSQYFNLRGLKVEGVRRPEVRREYNFTVYADNLGEANFLRSLASNSGTVPNITRNDGLDDAVEVQVYPGWPREVETFDDAQRKPARAFELRALEILT
jgi:hypothetical protein